MKKILAGALVLTLVLMPTSYSLARETGKSAKKSPEKLSLDIKGMDILDVFRLLSMRGGLNIIAGKSVTGKVTLFLKDVDVWEAFEIIIAANALAYEKRGTIVYVMTERDYELMYGKKYEDKRIVKSIKLNHVKAADISKAVSQLKTNIGRVVADETSETIVLMDIKEAITEMEKVIVELDVPLTTKVYDLQYAVAEDLKEKLSEMLTNNVGTLRVDDRTNKIAITDLEEKMPVFDKVISAFDEKHKEVIIEAKILQISLNDDCKMGINWDAVFVNFQNSLHPLATLGVNLKYSQQSDVIPTTNSTSGSGGALQIGQLDSEGYQAVVQALKEYGQTNILSSPRIAALNNEEAKILIGTNQPYATRAISQVSGGASNIEEENVTFLDLGVKLTVTPTINRDGFITMKIKPEVSSQTGTYTIESSGNTIPIVKTTTTETTVMVKDGATILIGGLIEDSQVENTKEVPGLSNIPLVGNLFRSKSRGSGDSTPEKTELVIFLTPRIITGEKDQNMLTVDKVAHDLAMNKIENREPLRNHELGSIMVDTLTPQEYYNIISSMITKEVERRRPSVPVYGEVIIAFTLDEYGELASEPKVYRGKNKILTDIGIKSIAQAGPFPAFPDSINKNKEIFQIAISYE